MKNLILASTLTLVLSACGSGGSSGGKGLSGSPSNTNPNLSELGKLQEGIYVSHNDICFDTNGYSPYYKMSYSYINNEFVVMMTYFLDGGCMTEYSVESSVYEFKNNSSELITFSLIDYQLLPLSQNLADDLNAQSIFGYTNWNTSMAKSIIDLPAQSGGPILYKSGTVKFIKVKVISGTNSVLIDNYQYNKQ